MMGSLVFSRRKVVGLAGASALVGLSAQGAFADPARPNPMPDDLRAALERDPAYPVLGNAKGDVTLVEFSDYNCSSCREMMETVAKVVADDPNLRLVIRDIAFFGEGSDYAARAALAAHQQRKYWPFHQQVMRQGRATAATVRRAAEAAGLDVARMERDMDKDITRAALARSMAMADHLGLPGTPSFVAGDEGHFGVMSYADLKAMVARARQVLNG